MSLLDYVSSPKPLGSRSWLRPLVLWASFCRKRWTGKAPLLDHPDRIRALPSYIPPQATPETIASLAEVVRQNMADPSRLLYRRAEALGPRLLEVGCGTGVLAVAMALRGKEVWCGDVEPYVTLVQALARHMGVADRVHVARFSADAIPFRAGFFDVVTMRAALEHVPATDRCLADVRRVLRPGGTFLFAVPGFPWYEVQAFLRGDPDLIFDYAHLHPSELNYWAWRTLLRRHFPEGRLHGKRLPGLGELGTRLPLPPQPSWADRLFAPLSSHLVGEYRKPQHPSDMDSTGQKS